MSRKLAISPDISYMLGICTLSQAQPSVSVTSKSDEVIERFVRIAITTLKIDPQKVIFEEEGSLKRALFYHSTIKRLISNALETRERVFKYKNDYSGSYFAGLFDARGRKTEKHIWAGTKDMTDIIILERLGIHVNRDGKLKNPNAYMQFIKPYSANL